MEPLPLAGLVSRSASPGSSTGSRSRWSARSRGALQREPVTLRLSEAQVGLSASALPRRRRARRARCSAGSPTGWGRKRLFSITLAVYALATVATALRLADFGTFALFRFLTGAGIGGEYAAINSAIQELIPARVRGRTDLAINGSFWIGAASARVGAVVLLDPAVLPTRHRLARRFRLGALLAVGILFLRRHVPESPRWLMTHGRADEAARIVGARSRHGVGAPTTAASPPVRRRPPSRCACARARSTSLARWRARLLRALPAAHAARPRADDLRRPSSTTRSSSPTRWCSTRFYGVAAQRRRPLPAAVRRRQLPRPAAARAAVRHARPARR